MALLRATCNTRLSPPFPSPSLTFCSPSTSPQQLRQLLVQHGTIEDLWLPAIKKFCYVVYAEEAHGEAAAAAVNGVTWPPTNATSILKPSYVAAEDAAAAISNGRAGIADTPKGGAGAAGAAAGGVVSPKGGAGPAVVGLARAGLTAAVAAAAADAAAAKQKAAAAAAPAAGRKRSEPEADGGVAAAENGGAAAAPATAVDAAAAEPPPLSLDDLFKKTTSKPMIYWLPLSEDKVEEARKKRKAEEAAEAEAEERRERERERDSARDRDRDSGRGGSGRSGAPGLPPPPPLPGPPLPGPPLPGPPGRDRDRGYGRR